MKNLSPLERSLAMQEGNLQMFVIIFFLLSFLGALMAYEEIANYKPIDPNPSTETMEIKNPEAATSR